MSINSVTTDWWASPTTTDTGSTTGTNNLSDFDSFVKLLATQLQYQDPTDPVSSTEYVSQMAQMSTLQQLQTISNSVNAYSAYAMIGKEVAYATSDTTAEIGTVDSVSIQNGTVYLYVDGTKVSFDSILEVGGEASET
jgi:flagellar basal-body rod modification protein FlgD